MKKKSSLVVLFLIILLNVKGQQQLFLGFQNGWAYGLTEIQQNKNYLKSKSFPWLVNMKLSLQYRIANAFSLEAGISNENFIWKVFDKNFKARYDNQFEAKMANKAGYLDYFLNIQYAFLLPSRFFSSTNHFYVQLGGGYHNYGSRLLTQQRDFIYGGDVVETIRMGTQYSKGAYYVAPEIGLQKVYRSTLFSVGIMGAFNLKNNMFKSDYTSVKPDGTVVTSDQLTAKGSYVGINFRFNLSLFYKEKKEKTPKEKKPKKEKEPKEKKKPQEKPKKEKEPKKKEEKPKKEKEDVKEKTTVDIKEDTKEITNEKKQAEDSVQVQPQEKDTLPSIIDTVQKVVNGRDYEVSHKINIHSRMAIIKVWDDKEVDGDSINLSFNGRWILEGYRLSRRPKEIQIELQDGVNNIVLYALNLGTYPPNTAAVAVFDGKIWRRITLESTLDNSGALQIYYTPPE